MPQLLGLTTAAAHRDNKGNSVQMGTKQALVQLKDSTIGDLPKCKVIIIEAGKCVLESKAIGADIINRTNLIIIQLI
jgi:hypothetical protein